MSKRNELGFPFPATEVLEAAKRKRMHHLERLAFYQAESAEAERDIRENGIQISGVQSGQRSTSDYTGYGPTIDLDRDKTHRFTQAERRATTHRKYVQRLDAFVRGLDQLVQGGDATVLLDVDDITWFRLDGAPVPDDQDDNEGDIY